VRDQIIDRLLTSPAGRAIEEELIAATLARRAEARARIQTAQREAEKQDARLDGACQKAQAELLAAAESCRVARRAVVAAENDRRGAIRSRQAIISEADRFLDETASAEVSEALSSVREESQRLRKADAADPHHLARREALTLQEQELTALLAEDDGLPGRIAEIAARIEPRTRRGEAIFRLEACLPRMTFTDSAGALPEQHQRLHNAISQLLAVDPLGKGAAKDIAAIMRPLEPYLRAQPPVARA
jgi:hypothetical protein